MKILSGFLLLALLVLQHQLWLGEDSVRALRLLQADVQARRDANEQLEQRNYEVQVEILDLKNGLEAVEERARSELGMIEPGETFYLIID